MTAWIGEVFTSDVGWNHLETLVDVDHRMAGSDGERIAAEATRDVLDEYTEEAWLEEFAIQGWERGSASIGAPGDPEDAIALPRSPAGTAQAPLLDLGHGLPEDFEETDVTGSIVMVSTDVPDWYDRFVHRREKYYYAVRDGAAGFVFTNHYEGGLAPTGSVGTDEDPIGDIPAVGVSQETGARLARKHDGDPIELDVEATIDDATSQNVHATLGPDTDEAVLVTSHVDAHDISEGAMDNGAGTAMIVEIARSLSRRESTLDRRVHLIAYGAEEVGLVGSHEDAADRDLDEVTAVLNLDGVVQARTLSFHTHGFDGLEAAVDAIAERFDHPMETTPEQSPHSDHWPYVLRGIPGFHVTSATGDAGRGWGHTAADTLDKLAVRTFREQAILLIALTEYLADDGFAVARASEADIAQALEDESLAEGMKVTGDWPY